MYKGMRKRGKYTDDYRVLVVKEYLSGGISKNALCRKYKIPQQVTLTNWIRKFVGDESKNTPMPEANPVPESEEIQKMRDEIKRLKLALYEEKMRAHAYDTMIDVAEEMFKIPIRKKADTKQ